jgi:hypothetical protein
MNDIMIIGYQFRKPTFDNHNTKVLLTASSKTMNTDKDSIIDVLVSKRLLERALTDDS